MVWKTVIMFWQAMKIPEDVHHVRSQIFFFFVNRWEKVPSSTHGFWTNSRLNVNVVSPSTLLSGSLKLQSTTVLLLMHLVIVTSLRTWSQEHHRYWNEAKVNVEWSTNVGLSFSNWWELRGEHKLCSYWIICEYAYNLITKGHCGFTCENVKPDFEIYSPFAIYIWFLDWCVISLKL